MLLSISGSYTRAQATESEAEWLYEYLSVEDVDHAHKARAAAERIRKHYVTIGHDLEGNPDHIAEFLDSVKRHAPDPRLRLYNRHHRVFPTGLVPLVRARAPDQGFRVDEVDTRPGRALLRSELDLEALAKPPLTLRPYQLEAVTAALTGPAGLVDPGCPSWVAPNVDPGRAILHLPTGAGKSRMAVGIAHTVPGVWLFLVHRNHLAADVANRWDTTVGELEGSAAGTIGGDGQWTEGERFTVATFQTLYPALESERFRRLAERVTGVIVDECHVSAAATFLKTIASFRNATYKIGLSGTPLARGDKKNLISVGALGPVVYRVRADELIKKGFLAQPTIRLVPCYQELVHGETWTEAYDELVRDSVHRNCAIAQCALVCERPGMVFVEREIHGKRLTKFLRSRGLNVEHVYGKTPKRLRQQAIRDLGEGDLDIVVASRVFNDGVDIPSLRSVIMGAAGKSEIAALQQAGRALRVEDGKTAATIYDIGDKGYFKLNNQVHERLGSYQREGYPIVVDREVWPERPDPSLELHRAWVQMF